jgi:N-acetylneuraminate synthase
MSRRELTVAGRRIGPGHPVYIVAELSANHNRSYNRAVELIEAARDAGADAVKLQTYTPDTMTIDCSNEFFRIGAGSVWEGRTFYELYTEAWTPWDWHPRLKAHAEGIGLQLFSTPFDQTAVTFLDDLDVPVFKVASFEVIDLSLIRAIAATGKPMIISTGMASRDEVAQAVSTARTTGTEDLALLRCTSAYPARPDEADLRTIPDLADRFDVVAGLSDHTMGIAVPVAAVALGACIVEKHFTLSRRDPGPDSSFSLEPVEFARMVEAVRVAEQSLGTVRYGPREGEEPSLASRRSLFVVEDIQPGECFTVDNLRSIRPGYGLPPAELDAILGRRAARKIERGTPMSWDLVAPVEGAADAD